VTVSRTLNRMVPGVVSLAVVVVGIAAFVAYFTADNRVLLVAQGPLSLQPSVAEELGLFFDGGLIRNGQIALHVLGVLVFWVTGLLAALWFWTREGLLVLLLLVAGFRAFGAEAGSSGDRVAFGQFVVLLAALSALTLIAVQL